MYVTTALLAAFVFFYSVFSGKLERTPFSGAIVYTTFGLVFGSFGFGLLDLGVGSESLSALAEFTLALVLFTDAANTDLKVLRHSLHNCIKYSCPRAQCETLGGCFS